MRERYLSNTSIGLARDERESGLLNVYDGDTHPVPLGEQGCWQKCWTGDCPHVRHRPNECEGRWVKDEVEC